MTFGRPISIVYRVVLVAAPQVITRLAAGKVHVCIPVYVYVYGCVSAVLWQDLWWQQCPLYSGRTSGGSKVHCTVTWPLVAPRFTVLWQDLWGQQGPLYCARTSGGTNVHCIVTWPLVAPRFTVLWQDLWWHQGPLYCGRTSGGTNVHYTVAGPLVGPMSTILWQDLWWYQCPLYCDRTSCGTKVHCTLTGYTVLWQLHCDMSTKSVIYFLIPCPEPCTCCIASNSATTCTMYTYLA